VSEAHQKKKKRYKQAMGKLVQYILLIVKNNFVLNDRTFEPREFEQGENVKEEGKASDPREKINNREIPMWTDIQIRGQRRHIDLQQRWERWVNGDQVEEWVGDIWSCIVET